jgi:hypothetical protein
MFNSNFGFGGGSGSDFMGPGPSRTVGNSSTGFSNVFDARNKALAGTHTYAGGNTPFYSGADFASGVKGYIDKRNATPLDEYGGLVTKNNSIGPHRMGDYMFSQTGDGRYYAMNTKDPTYGTKKTKADIYDASGKYLGSDFYDTEKSAMGKMWDAAIPLMTTAMIGGGIAGGFGVGPFAGGGGAGVVPPNPFVGGGAVAAGGGGLAGGGGGLAGLFGGLGGGGSMPSLGSIIKGIGGVAGALGGGSGGGGLQDLLGVIGGGVDAKRQGDAAKAMEAWLKSNQAKMDGYMNPNSPEYKAMWEEMSRKDAAAGRNSQYGPRTSDFLAEVAKAKAENTLRFTTGTSRAYADALNQNASKYAGLSAGLGNFLQGGSGGGGLSSILNGLFGGAGGGGGNASGGADLGDVWSGVSAWDDAWSKVLNGGDSIDYGAFF